MQEGKPIAFASKSLTPSEINYAQIEKEMFAILFGCRRFHQYIYGHEVKVETDQKPLVSIMKKTLLAAPPRLQRIILQLHRYELEINHLHGKSIPVADTLSRKYLADTYPKLSEGMEAHVHTIISSVPVSDRKFELIKLSTERDMQLVTLKEFILSGWPDTRKECPAAIIDFWNHRDQLSFSDGLIMKGHKIVIPKELRSEMLETVHAGHM